jgi:hypothetical protein
MATKRKDAAKRPADEDDLRELVASTKRRIDKALARAQTRRARKVIEAAKTSLDQASSFPKLKKWCLAYCRTADRGPYDLGVAQLRTFVGAITCWTAPRSDVLIELADLRPLAHVGLPLPKRLLAEASVLEPDASARATVHAEQALAELDPARPVLDEGTFDVVFDDAVSVEVPADELDDPKEWFQEIDPSGRATSAPHAAMRLPERERAANAALASLVGEGEGVVLVSWHVNGLSAMFRAPVFRRHWGKIVRAALGEDAIALPLRPIEAAWALAWHHRERVQMGKRRARWPHRFDIREYDREPQVE